LIEGLAFDAVGKAMHGHDPFPNMRKHGLGNLLIVVDEIAFGVPLSGKSTFSGREIFTV
jgi:hypothetical protein